MTALSNSMPTPAALLKLNFHAAIALVFWDPGCKYIPKILLDIAPLGALCNSSAPA